MANANATSLLLVMDDTAMGSSLWAVLFEVTLMATVGFVLPTCGAVDAVAMHRGLGDICRLCLLPAVIFKCTVEMRRFSDLDMEFLGVMVSVQAVLFAGTYCCVMKISPAGTHEARKEAALAAMTVTNENKSALALVVLPVLFGPIAVDYVTIGILVIQLVVLPMTILLSTSPQEAPFQALMNPLVAASTLGLLVRCTIGGSLPSCLKLALDCPANAFAAVANILVGFGIWEASQLEEADRTAVKRQALLLSGLKMCATPLLVALSLACMGKSDATVEFGFLWGSIPTAPSSIMIAHQVRAEDRVGLICVTILLTTLAWGPLVVLSVAVFSNGEVGGWSRGIGGVFCVTLLSVAAISMAAAFPLISWRDMRPFQCMLGFAGWGEEKEHGVHHSMSELGLLATGNGGQGEEAFREAHLGQQGRYALFEDAPLPPGGACR